jgi:hypothetical protein
VQLSPVSAASKENNFSGLTAHVIQQTLKLSRMVLKLNMCFALKLDIERFTEIVW